MGSSTGAVSIPAPPIPANTAPCGGGGCSYSAVMPASVAALLDGTRFYVASYVTAAPGSPCPDPTIAAAGCVIPQVTAFDAATLTVKTTIFPLLPPVGEVQQFALAPAAFCVPVIPYTPASSRFRMSAAAATDSSRVYASMCDGGTVAVIATVPNTISVGVQCTRYAGDRSAGSVQSPPRTGTATAAAESTFSVDGTVGKFGLLIVDC